MAKASKFTDEQKLEVALELLTGKVSHAEVCRKWDISSTYAYKLKDRAVDILRKGIGRPAGRPSGEVEQLRKRVTDLEQLAGDQALLIRHFKKTRYQDDRYRDTFRRRAERSAFGESCWGACLYGWQVGWAQASQEGGRTQMSGLRGCEFAFTGSRALRYATAPDLRLSSDMGVVAS
jgi:transposase-like protein